MFNTRTHQRQRGSVAIEMAVLAPVVLLFIFSVIQGALWYHARNVALSAATEGARAAAAESASADAGADAALRLINNSGNGDLRSVTISPYRSAVEARVTVTGQSRTLIPGITLSVSQTAAFPVERFTTPGSP